MKLTCEINLFCMCASVGDLSHAHFRTGTELNHLLGQWQTIILLLASLGEANGERDKGV